MQRRSCQSFAWHIMHHLVQKRFMSTPKIKLKIDPSLDVHADRDKILRPIFKIRDFILRQESKSIKVRYLEIKRKQLGLASKNVGAKAYLRRFPNMFEIYAHPHTKEPWCKMTQAMLDLIEEEKQIYRDTKDEVVLKLRRLLMMSKDRRIKSGKIDFARRSLGFPDDLATRVAPLYPQYFRVFGKSPSPFIELVAWDEKIAISELEKKAKEEALRAGYGDIETRGQPLAFKITHSPGMYLKRKNLELLQRWQQLPYVSPYQDYSWITVGTSISEKRIVAVLHELLSLTVEKKALMQVLGRFREEFGLPQSIGKLVNRFPGIFYVSLKGNNKTIFLREGYAREGYHNSHLIEDHPLVQLKFKYAQLVREGPRARAIFREKCKAECGEDATEGNESENEKKWALDYDEGIVTSELEDEEEDDASTENEEDDDEEEEEPSHVAEMMNLKPKKEIW